MRHVRHDTDTETAMTKNTWTRLNYTFRNRERGSFVKCTQRNSRIFKILQKFSATISKIFQVLMLFLVKGHNIVCMCVCVQQAIKNRTFCKTHVLNSLISMTKQCNKYPRTSLLVLLPLLLVAVIVVVVVA